MHSCWLLSPSLFCPTSLPSPPSSVPQCWSLHTAMPTRPGAGWYLVASGQCKALIGDRRRGEGSWSFFLAFSLLPCPCSGTLWQEIWPSSCPMAPLPLHQLLATLLLLSFGFKSHNWWLYPVCSPWALQHLLFSVSAQSSVKSTFFKGPWVEIIWVEFCFLQDLGWCSMLPVECTSGM